MKNTIKLLLSILLLQSQAYALNIRSIDKTIWTGTEALRMQFPSGQVTQVGDKSFYIETGYKNILPNPNFEAITLAEGWNNTPGASSFAVLDSGNQREGLRGVTVTMLAGTHTEMEAIYSTPVTPGVDWTGTNVGGSLWIKNTRAGMKLCIRRLNASNSQEARSCVDLQADGIWHEYVTPGVTGGDSTKKYMLTVLKTGTIAVGPGETFQVDGEGYIGDAKIGYGTPPNEFGAYILANGTVSYYSPTTSPAWISGCAKSGTNSSIGTCTLNGFTSAPVCTFTPGATANGMSARLNSITANQIVYQTYDTSTSAQSIDLMIKCNKAGSDFVQPAITAQNFDRSKTDYTPTVTGLGTGSGTFTYAYWFKEGGNATTCLYFTKDASAGSGSTPVEFTLPLGFTPDIPNNASVIGSGLTNKVSLQPISLAVYNGKMRFFKSGAASVQGADLAANGVYIGCVTVPMQGYTATQGAPQLLGSVTSDANFAEKLVRVHVNGGNDSTNCTGSCTLSNTNSTAFTSVSNVGGGSYTAVISGFSGTPLCWCNAYDTVNPSLSCGIKGNTSTTLFIRTLYGTTLTNGILDIFCLGPR